jgi:predicted transposase/invertase (TIGR01784 family)
MGNSIETKKSEATMRGKYLNQDIDDPMKIPAEFLDENGNWRMLDRREKSMLTEGQLYAYERFWLSVVDERILREAAVKKGYNEGMEKGMQKGMEKGMQKGMEEGMQKGMEEGMQKGMEKKSFEIAKRMKQSGMSDDVIAEMTGLSIDNIDSL